MNPKSFLCIEKNTKGISFLFYISDISKKSLLINLFFYNLSNIVMC